MKVLFDARLHHGVECGMSRYIINLLTQLADINQISLTVIYDKTLHQNDDLLQLINRKNLSNIPSKIPRFGPLNTSLLPIFLNSTGFDVYHHPHYNVPKLKATSVITIHDVDALSGVSRVKGSAFLKNRYIKYSIKQSLKKASGIIYISKATKMQLEMLAPKISDKPNTVIYSGLNKFDYTFTSQINAPFTSYNLYVGSLRNNKNILFLIDVFKEIPHQNLLIISRNKPTEYGITHLPENVKILGNISDNLLGNYYQNARAFLFPSIIEGFGMPILEAMQYNLPIIASNIQVFKEVSEEKVVLIDPTKKEVWKENIVNISKNLPDYSSILNKYNWKTCGQQTFNFYQEVIKSKKK